MNTSKVAVKHRSLRSEILKRLDLLTRYKKSLEGLTVGGSEFVNDPEYCAKYVRERIHSTQDLLKKTLIENKRLSAQPPAASLDKIADEIAGKSRTYAHGIPAEVVKEILVYFAPPATDQWVEEAAGNVTREFLKKLNKGVTGAKFVELSESAAAIICRHRGEK